MSQTVKLRGKQTLPKRSLGKANLLKKRKKSPDPSKTIPRHIQIENNEENETATDSFLNFSPPLDASFYNQPCINLAKNLLGKTLVRKLDTGEILKGRIVETECYQGGEDKASHSFNGKRTIANEPMFMPPGTAYVYLTYGMYDIFNISSLGHGAAVLLRALEPLENIPIMNTLRCAKRKSDTICKNKDLCNGPGKLCQAFNIVKKSANKMDMCTSTVLWIEHGVNVPLNDIVECKRIGIDSVGAEWADKPFRFYIRNCPWVSVRNKLAEQI